MYYKQNINDIQLAILSFDDVMFDFNKLRYNYLKRLCNINELPFDNNEFILNLGSSKKMYQNSSLIENLYSKEELETKADEDLYTFCKINGISIKPGINELLELLNQRNIPVVAVSSHSTEIANKLFKISNIYREPSLIIGEDTVSEGLPSVELYQYALNKYNLTGDKVCVIASTYNSVIAANKLRCNVIFVPELAKANKEMEIRSMKIDNNLLEVINTLLFGKYEELGIYYPLIKNKGSNLTENYRLLVEQYKDDKEVLSILETIYDYEFSNVHIEKLSDETKGSTTELEDDMSHSLKEPIEIDQTEAEDIKSKESELNDQNELSENSNQEVDSSESPVNDDSDTETLYYNMIDTLSMNKKDFIEAINEEELHKKEDSINEELAYIINDIETSSTEKDEQENEEEKLRKQEELSNTFFSKEELKFFGNKDVVEEDNETDNQVEEHPKKFKFKIIEDLFYSFLCSILVVFFSLIIYLALESWLTSTNSIAFFIMTIVNGYTSFCRFIFCLIPMISTQLVAKQIISDLFLTCLSFVVVNTIIMFLILFISNKIKERKDNI